MIFVRRILIDTIVVKAVSEEYFQTTDVIDRELPASD